jgi:Zn-dependent peptidase ImmA (M78 family)/DNA-binding XRE family transcriptional regulator
MSSNVLDTIDMRTLGQELKRARKQSGYTQEEAAKFINVARTTLIAIENGERKIRAHELIELAQVYGRQVSDFVRSRPIIEPFTNRQFRAPATLREKYSEEVEQSIALFEDVCRNYLELERITGRPIIRRYPTEYVRKSSNIEAEAEALAQAERSRLGLGNGPLPPLRDILEQDVGIRIFYLDLKPNILSGIYYYSDELGGCIAINSNHPEDRCRWTLVHDYWHFLADRERGTAFFYGGYQRVPESERFADAGTAYFLMPTISLQQHFEDVYNQYEGITPEALCVLAHRYGVSFEAMTRRLQDMRRLPVDTWDRIKESGLKIQEIENDLGLEATPGRRDMFPLHYRALALQALKEEQITEGQFANFLKIDRLQARKISNELQQKEPFFLERDASTARQRKNRSGESADE